MATQRPRAARLAFVGLFIALQLVTLLIALEILGRIFNPIGISYYPETARYMSTMILEEPIGYRNRPNLKGTYYRQPLEINSLGLRNREIDPEGDESVFRILVLGDSFVFGVAVQDDETLPVLLEEMLQERHGRIDEREIDVVNMGVISYNTYQELVQFREIGARLEPDLVLLLFTYNDIEPKMWIFDKRGKWWAALGQRSYAISLLFKLRMELKRRYGTPVQMIAGSNYEEGNPRWEEIESSLAELARMTDEAGVPVVVYARFDDGPEWQLLSRAGEEQGFPVVSLMPYGDARWKDSDAATHVAVGGGSHLNREGLFIYTTLVYESLQELGLLPRSTAATPSPAQNWK